MTDRTKEEIRYLTEIDIKNGTNTLKLETRGEVISAAQICIDELEKITVILDEAFPELAE